MASTPIAAGPQPLLPLDTRPCVREQVDRADAPGDDLGVELAAAVDHRRRTRAQDPFELVELGDRGRVAGTLHLAEVLEDTRRALGALRRERVVHRRYHDGAKLLEHGVEVGRRVGVDGVVGRRVGEGRVR